MTSPAKPNTMADGKWTSVHTADRSLPRPYLQRRKAACITRNRNIVIDKKVGFRRSRRVNVIVFSESAFEQMSEVNSGWLCIRSWTTATSTLFLQQTKRNCHVAAPMTVCCFVVTPPPISEWSIVMSVSACVCVCLSDRDQNYTSDLRHSFVHVTYGRGSVLLWRRSDTLCTSGFTDDVMFAHKPRLLDLAAQLKRSAHAALGLAVNCAQ